MVGCKQLKRVAQAGGFMKLGHLDLRSTAKGLPSLGQSEAKRCQHRTHWTPASEDHAGDDDEASSSHHVFTRSMRFTDDILGGWGGLIRSQACSPSG